MTTNGSSTRQSVASVACETRARPPKVEIVRARDAGERQTQARALVLLLLEPVAETLHRRARRRQQFGRALVVVQTPLELIEPMVERLEQQPSALEVVEQIVLQIGIAGHDPHVAQHLEQHPRRAPGAARAAQFLDHAPHRLAQEADDDLAIGEGGVVVGDLAETGG
jgi:hypothetical protein